MIKPITAMVWKIDCVAVVLCGLERDLFVMCLVRRRRLYTVKMAGKAI